MSSNEETFSIPDITCLFETDKALKCSREEYPEPFWVPKSQVHEDSEVFETGHVGTLVVTLWWAEQHSLF